MASELPPEQQASYSAIIDDILAQSDLNTISAKRIRKGLQERVDYDITPQKQAITDLIMLRFDKFQRDRDTKSTPSVPEPAPTTNGTAIHTKHEPHADSSRDEASESGSPNKRIAIEVKPEHKTEYPRHDTSEPTSPTKRKAAAVSDDEDEDDMSDVVDSPPPKKVKKVGKVKPTSTTETDEEIAKRMQAELNAQAARSTRGGGTARRKPAIGKKAGNNKTPTKAKKKSKAKINSDDDSDVAKDSDGNEKPERPKTGGFHKPMTLSEPLAALVGAPALSRPQTVKKIWAYVKERDLQDPNDKRQIRCDEAMRAVFKQDKVHMFTMNKLLALHLYAQDE